MSKKILFENVKLEMKTLGFDILNKYYLNNETILILIDKYNYYYVGKRSKLIRNEMPSRFHKSNPYIIQNIKLWCKLNDKSFELVSDTYISAINKLKWKCLKKDCGEVFDCSWNDIRNGNNCGVCSGHQVKLSNCLATKNPKLASEWHKTLNRNLTPYDVTCGNKIINIWWICNKKHIWQNTIYNRNKYHQSCPYCSNHLPSKDYNLLIINPELCEEWNHKKNDKNPEEYCPNSNDYAWWICKECGYEWEARTNSRNSEYKTGCPECSKSKGEKKCKEFFINKRFIETIQKEYDNLSNTDKEQYTYFISQKTFDGLIGLGGGLLSYDFYLPEYNLLVEYQGQYHDGSVKNQTKKQLKKQQEHDRRKKEYAEQNKYNLLEIWYWDFDNIESIIDEYIKSNSIPQQNVL